jgi:radical SAM protein with 4Fe4S-binding SPASM domain
LECAGLPDSGYLPFRGKIYANALTDRVPISGSIEITSGCNLGCVHCYISGSSRSPGELTLGELKDLVDQIAAEGCLWLLVTGGEPLIREDFRDIYEHVKRRGILPMLFSNGTLVTDSVADLLASEPPYLVEISIYGATAETFEAVTRVPGSFTECMKGIDRLLTRGVRLHLKTMALSLNAHEVMEMKTLAERLGVTFRFDTMLNCGLDGNVTPLDYRLSPEDILDLDRQDENRMRSWMELVRDFPGQDAGHNRIYQCGAGISTFHIDSTGKFSVCMLSREENFDLRTGTFHDGWESFVPRVLAREWSRETPCRTCRLKSMCGQCPGWGYLEQGDPEDKVEYLCSVAGKRARMLGLADQTPYTSS